MTGVQTCALPICFPVTIARLGLKEQIDGYGQQKFVQLYGEDCSIQSYGLVIIDEVSQLSDELFNLLLKYVKPRGVKIIFVGDPAQIPPVNCLDCIPLSKEGQDKYNIGVSELNTIQRQSEGNPIIVTSMKIRTVGIYPPRRNTRNKHIR